MYPEMALLLLKLKVRSVYV